MPCRSASCCERNICPFRPFSRLRAKSNKITTDDGGRVANASESITRFSIQAIGWTFEDLGASTLPLLRASFWSMPIIALRPKVRRHLDSADALTRIWRSLEFSSVPVDLAFWAGLHDSSNCRTRANAFGICCFGEPAFAQEAERIHT